MAVLPKTHVVFHVTIFDPRLGGSTIFRTALYCRQVHWAWIPEDVLPPFITQSVHYKTVSTPYVVEPKILHYLFNTCLAQ
jgi:hypothetical protein